MRSITDLESVRRLLAEGLNDCEISRRTGVPRSTVRGWRTGRQRAGADGTGCVACNSPAHDFASLPSPAYAYLLGQYLGDGTITQYRRWTALFVSCCDAYPNIMREVGAAITAVLPGTTVGHARRTGCTAVRSHSRQWPCLFPQHGPGPKHERRIRLTDWQIEHCERHPDMLLRGLIQSDGCRCVNRIRSKAGKTYEYPRYFFSNASDDILLICGAAFERVGVSYTWTDDRNLSVARRADVARLDAFIGPKA